MKQSLLSVNKLKKYFPISGGMFSSKMHYVKAVDDVSFDIMQGETLGVVGESGCGKTTLVNVLLNLLEPTSGTVHFEGVNIIACNKKELRRLRRNLQIVFQDPFWSLNPRWLVKDIVGEPLKVHYHHDQDVFLRQVKALLEMVDLPGDSIYQYPHEFSGGQRQRIAIARALALKPKLLVLDEPTSSIDLFSQARILRMLEELRDKLSLTYILISHDLSVVNCLADMIAVMYLGQIMEFGPAKSVFNKPVHPYTQALFNAIPDLNTRSLDDIVTLEGALPSAINAPSGCRFHTRCPEFMPICAELAPSDTELDVGHKACCHLLETTSDKNSNKESIHA